MTKKSLVFTALLAVIIIAGIVFAILKKNTPSPQIIDTPSSQSTEQSSVQQQQQVSMVAKGIYADYSVDSFSSTQGTRILFFHAPWCPQCRMLDQSIKESAIPDNVTIFKIDYDSNQNLRAKYGVTLQTTFVKVDDADNKVASFTAYSEPNFQSVKRALLP